MKECKEIPLISQKDIKRFWSKVAITANDNKCWEWQAGTNGGRYGKFNIRENSKDISVSAHRFSFFINNNIQPKGNFVLHSCDNMKCVNPKHLRLGTQQDNMDDMVSRGRSISKPGEFNPMAKLSKQDVIKIREMYSQGVFQKDIGVIFGITQSGVGLIVRGERWANLK